MNCVSVIIPAYNKSEYTLRAIDSVLAQTFKDIELLVIDDGSTDDTPARLAVYGNKIQYVRKVNGGACSARNHGIRLARGEYIAFLDCDDVYKPPKIKESVDFLKRNPQVGFVHTAAELIDRADKVVGLYAHPNSQRGTMIARQLIMGNHIANSTVVVRKSCLDDVGMFDETFFTPADWDMWLRLAEKYPAGYLPQALTQYRVADNYIFNRLELARREEKIVIDRYFQRNSSASSFFKSRVLSQFHLRFAQCFVLKDNDQEVCNELKQSLRLCPWNLKAWGILTAYVFMRAPLKRYLHKKILRLEQ